MQNIFHSQRGNPYRNPRADYHRQSSRVKSNLLLPGTGDRCDGMSLEKIQFGLRRPTTHTTQEGKNRLDSSYISKSSIDDSGQSRESI